MSTAIVVAIFVCENAGEPMQLRREVRALAGAGLENDRYSKAMGSWNKGRLGKRQVSLIDLGIFAEANLKLQDPILPGETRRNILTEGIDLHSLLGREFLIGEVRMHGIKHCDPCDRPDKLSGKKGFADAFGIQAGILADILSSGLIKVGDTILRF